MLKRADEHLLVIRCWIRSARAGRRQARDEKWNLGSVKAVLNNIQELKASKEIDTPVDKQKYITNQSWDEHSRAPLCTRCTWNTRALCRSRFEIIWNKELAEAETVNHTADSIRSSPRATKQTVATEEVNTDQIDERDGAAC